MLFLFTFFKNIILNLLFPFVEAREKQCLESSALLQCSTVGKCSAKTEMRYR